MPLINFPSWVLTLTNRWQQDSAAPPKFLAKSDDGTRSIFLRPRACPLIYDENGVDEKITEFTAGYVRKSSSATTQVWIGDTPASSGDCYIFRVIQPGKFPEPLLYLSLANVKFPDDNNLINELVTSVTSWDYQR